MEIRGLCHRKRTVHALVIAVCVCVILYVRYTLIIWDALLSDREKRGPIVRSLEAPKTGTGGHSGRVMVMRMGENSPGVNNDFSAVDIACPTSDTVVNETRFTSVIQAYKRDTNLLMILKTYCMYNIIDHLYIVWNDVRREPIVDTLGNFTEQCIVSMTFMVQKRNLMRNKFQELPLCKTKAILVQDDDWLFEEDDLQLLFFAWKSHPDMIVGQTRRSHIFKDKKYMYFPSPSDKYSMILTDIAMIHRNFLVNYKNQPAEILHYIDTTQNCDDIAMNFLVASTCGQNKASALWVKQRTRKKHLSSGSYAAHWRPQHYRTRESCLNIFTGIYGGMPLQYTTKYFSENAYLFGQDDDASEEQFSSR